MSRLAARRRGHERGALLVELAMVVPILALLALGAVEFGLAWQDRLTAQSATRAGVRTGSALGKIASADQEILLAAGAVVQKAGMIELAWVVVYKSTTADGALPGVCATPGPRSVSGVCNAYTGAQLQQVVDGTAPVGWFGCGAGSLDASWCPTSRQSVLSLGPDYLGVWVSADHRMLTGFFGATLTVRDEAVMRIEPAEA